LTAGGFQDTTRIAAGDPELWSAILLANAAGVAAGIQTVCDRLAELRSAIQQQDKGRLEALLRAAKESREALGTNSKGFAANDQSKGAG
jgi:prephenate dehydrogenase